MKVKVDWYLADSFIQSDTDLQHRVWESDPDSLIVSRVRTRR